MASLRSAAPTPSRALRRGGRCALVFGLLVVPMSCGDDDSSGDDDTTEITDGAGATDGADATGGDADTAEIVIADFAFSGPSSVPVGTTVVVRNDDSTEHTWTSADGEFTSGTLAGGDTFSFTFDEPGEFNYACAFHPSMTGTITVTG